ADHPLAGRGALGHACERRARLAAHAEDDQVPVQPLELLREVRSGRRHVVLEGIHVGEAPGKRGGWCSGGHGAIPFSEATYLKTTSIMWARRAARWRGAMRSRPKMAESV